MPRRAPSAIRAPSPRCSSPRRGSTRRCFTSTGLPQVPLTPAAPSAARRRRAAGARRSPPATGRGGRGVCAWVYQSLAGGARIPLPDPSRRALQSPRPAPSVSRAPARSSGRRAPAGGPPPGSARRTLTSMWNRRKPAAVAPAPQQDPSSLLESCFPGAVEEHPAKRRIRRSNEIAAEMRQTGGRHRLDIPAPRGQ